MTTGAGPVTAGAGGAAKRRTTGPVSLRQGVLRLFWGGLAGKALGLLREVLLAAAYGVTAPAAAARVAQTGTLVPVNLVTAEALTAGFLPLQAALLREDPARAATLFHTVRRLLWGSSLPLVALLGLAGQAVVSLLAPGLSASTATLAAQFLFAMALGVPSYLQYCLLNYQEMAHGHFRLASVRATAQSLGMIVGVCLAWWLSAPVLIAWGFTAAYVGLHAWGWASLRRRGLHAAPARWSGPDARVLLARLWRRIRPLLLLPVVLQTSIALERVVASFMGAGVVAAVDYARTIADSGVALLAVPLGFAGLAVLAALPEEEARARLERLLPRVLVVVVPVSTLLALNSTRVVDVVFGHGRFDAAAVLVAGEVLWGLALGFWAQTVAYVLVKALNARDRNGTAARAMVAGLVCTIAVNVGAHRELGPAALGLAATVGAVVTAVVAARGLGVGAVLARCTAWCVPGAVLAVAAGSVVAADGWVGLLLSSVLAGAVWMAWFACVAVLRPEVVAVLRRGRG